MDPIFDQYIYKYINPQTPQGVIILTMLLVWSITLKGLALWKCSRNDQKTWFVAILVINTLGILELAYLFYFAKQKLEISQVIKSIQTYKIQNPFNKS